jgi:prepilin-type N-terminal cleavage/methylation domain-containing protein
MRGFTLVEIIVSVGIFATVMTIALGALLAMSESNRRVETLKSVINNLNFALDSMSRSIRTGSNYHCTTSGSPDALTLPHDCAASPDTYFTFKVADGNQVTYCLNGTTINRQVTIGTPSTDCSSANFLSITAPEVVITTLKFYTTGAQRSDTLQPKVTILISGYTQVSTTQRSTFNLQTSVTQRIYDQ